MNYITVATVFCICLSTSFATYGPDYKRGPPNRYYEAPRQLNEPKIHLNSPKIILERPSINVQDAGYNGPLHEDEPIILGHDNPLYIRKSLHGVHGGSVVNAARPAPVPIHYDEGYSHGKVLDITAPIQVISHAPIVKERSVLVRRPVVVSKSLSDTQDHLEKLHYVHSGQSQSAGYGEFSVPLSKALQERTVVYGGLLHGYGGLGQGYGNLAHGYESLGQGHGNLAHGYGGGQNAPAYYSAPLFVQQPRSFILEQPKAYGHSNVGNGAQFHAHSGHLHSANLKKY